MTIIKTPAIKTMLHCIHEREETWKIEFNPGIKIVEASKTDRNEDGEIEKFIFERFLGKNRFVNRF